MTATTTTTVCNTRVNTSYALWTDEAENNTLNPIGCLLFLWGYFFNEASNKALDILVGSFRYRKEHMTQSEG